MFLGSPQCHVSCACSAGSSFTDAARNGTISAEDLLLPSMGFLCGPQLQPASHYGLLSLCFQDKKITR